MLYLIHVRKGGPYRTGVAERVTMRRRSLEVALTVLCIRKCCHFVCFGLAGAQ